MKEVTFHDALQITPIKPVIPTVIKSSATVGHTAIKFPAAELSPVAATSELTNQIGEEATEKGTSLLDCLSWWVITSLIVSPLLYIIPLFMGGTTDAESIALFWCGFGTGVIVSYINRQATGKYKNLILSVSAAYVSCFLLSLLFVFTGTADDYERLTTIVLYSVFSLAVAAFPAMLGCILTRFFLSSHNDVSQNEI